MREEPTTSTASARASAAKASSTKLLGTLSPKKTTSGFSTPPQPRQPGTTKLEKSSVSRSELPQRGYPGHVGDVDRDAADRHKCAPLAPRDPGWSLPGHAPCSAAG